MTPPAARRRARTRADAVHIVSLGSFTPDARRFAQGKPINLVTGRELHARIRAAQAGVEARAAANRPITSGAPPCPVCTGKMVTRHNRRTGETFWGCVRFPQCRGTVAIGS